MGKKGTSSIIVLFSIIILCFLVIQISEFVKKVQADVDKLQIGTTSESVQTFMGTPEFEGTPEFKDGLHVTGGNVGIGTTAPSRDLEVYGFNPAVIINDSGASDPVLFFYDAGVKEGGIRVDESDGNTFEFETSGNSNVLVLKGANVGIGTVDPTEQLHIKGVGASIRLYDSANSTTDGGGVGLSHQFIYSGTTGQTSGSEIGMYRDSITDGNYGSHIRLSTRQHGASASEKMRITGTGNVGIGTTSPVSKLHVRGTVNVSYGDGEGGIYSGGSSGNTHIPYTNGAVYLSGHDIFLRSGANATLMTILNEGNVGIGTTDPGLPLEVHSGSNDIVAGFYAPNNTAGDEMLIHIGGTGQISSHYGVLLGAVETVSSPGIQDHDFVIKTNPGTGMAHTERFRITSNGNVGIGTTSPGSKLSVVGAIGLGAPETDTIYNGATGAGAALIGKGGYWGLRQSTNHNINFDVYNSASPITAATIQQNGNVGIGTVSPGAKLTVGGGQFALYGSGLNGSTYQRLQIYADTTYGLLFEAPLDSGSNKLDYSFAWRGAAAAMTIDGPTGNVGIGTAAPAARLTIWDNTSDESQMIRIGAASDGDYKIYRERTTGTLTIQGTQNGYNNFSYKDDAGSVLFRILENGNVGIKDLTPDYTLDIVGSLYVGGSSRRYKKNIKDIEIDSEKIYKLRAVSYDFKEEHKDKGVFLGKGRQIGIIAEEVYDVIPELAIREEEGGLVSDTDYEKLAVVMLPEVQKHEKKINLLSKIVNTVTKTINATLVETKKLIVDGVDILKKLNELSERVEKQQIEINALKEKVNKLQQVKVN